MTATPTPKLRQMITEFPDGIVIGWDFCSTRNKGCGQHVSQCACKGGPKEPEVFATWREQATWPGHKSLVPQITNPSKHPTDDAAQPVGVKIKPAAKRRAEAEGTTEAGQSKGVTCVTCEDVVSPDAADKNDDGTWSCHECQEAGVQRGRSAD